MPGTEIEGYRLRPAAAADLDDLWNHMASTSGPDQADDYIRGFVRTFDVLVDFPGIA